MIHNLEKIGLLPKQAMIILGLLGAIYVVPVTMLPIYIALCIYALRGPKEAIESLTISFLLVFLNPGVFSKSGSILMLRWLVLLAAFVRVSLTLLQERRKLPDSLLYFALFVFVTAGFSFTVSLVPEISLSKLFQFTIGVFTIICAFRLTEEYKNYFASWFMNLFIIVSLLSLPLYFSDLGYLRNLRGFQGVLNHPQTFGVFLGPLTAWLVIRYITHENRNLYILIGAIFGFLGILASQARVGFVSAVAGIGIVLVYQILKYRRFSTIAIKNNKPKMAAGIISIFTIIFTIFNFSTITGEISDFLQKGSEYETLGDGYQASRGFLIGKSMENFRENPISGIGFGIASDERVLRYRRSESLGFITGAAVEKGFLPSAVLEEVGIVGTFFFTIFIISLLKLAFSTALASDKALIISSLFINIGEMIFFSFGGLGMYMWLLIGFSTQRVEP